VLPGKEKARRHFHLRITSHHKTKNMTKLEGTALGNLEMMERIGHETSGQTGNETNTTVVVLYSTVVLLTRALG
jgi:hypothetical protein